MYRGDIRLGDTIDFKFTTRQVSGAPFTLAGSPVVSAYVGNGTTQITAGITLTVDFDAVTGLNNVRVVASSGNGFATNTNVELVITTGTVNSVSVVGEVIGSFSIEARSAVMPTVALRTLDVTATGAAGIDWGNVENPTTALNLSATNIDVDQVVASVSGAVGSVTGLTASNLDTTVSSRLAAASYSTPPSVGAIADQVWDEVLSGHLTAGTTGAALDAAGSAGDPWIATLPGSYVAGQAGYILSTALDAQLTAITTNINGVQQATIIKNSTGIIHFPMVLTSDHFTAATGKTVTGQKSDGTGAYAAVTGTITEIGLGDYAFSYSAADSNIDSGSWIFSATGCDNTLVPFITSE